MLLQYFNTLYTVRVVYIYGNRDYKQMNSVSYLNGDTSGV